MPIKIQHYSNEEVTILWQAELYIHSGICFRGFAEVLDPRRQPWIDMSRAATNAIIEQVKKCPSGALSITVTSNDEQL